MKPKEKAEQLVNSFYYALPNNGSSKGLNSTNVRYKEATVCALIAVNELIESHLLLTTTHESAPSVRCKRYWLQVKQEIENIGGDK